MCEREQFFCSLFVFINMGFEDIIDQFHAGEFDPELYFGDYDTFFSVLEKRKLMDSSLLNSLGWQPNVDLIEGLRLAYQDFLKNIETIRK